MLRFFIIVTALMVGLRFGDYMKRGPYLYAQVE